MLWLTALFAFSGFFGLFYFHEITKIIPQELFAVVWFIAGMLLTELTLLDMLHNARLRKKVAFALVLHFIPVLSVAAYWWWKVRWNRRENGSVPKRSEL